jgi:hypothetical protein
MRVASLPTLETLRRHVLEILCGHDRLDPGQVTMQEEIIRRSGRNCGLWFQVSGPRLLKSYAVWAGEENRILFYDSTGARFSETRLNDSPDAGKLAA